MVKIILLDRYRQQSLLRVGFKRWRLRFDQAFQAHTGLADLTPRTLYELSRPGGEAITDLYSLIIGFLGYGREVTFDDLDSKAQTLVLDIHLFISDQIRFEMMYRLGWLDRFSGNRFPLLEIVTDFERIRQFCSRQPPSLAKNHSDYEAYCLLFDLDQQVFLRRLFPAAMAAFKGAHNL